MKDKFPVFPISLILTEKFESIKRINKIEAPILILKSESDIVIKHEYTDNLIKEYKGSKLEQFIIKNTDHNDINYSQDFFLKVIYFLTK